MSDELSLTTLDTYEIGELPTTCRLLLIGMHVDQIHLARHRHVLDAFLSRGGTLVVGGGHLVREIYTGAPRWEAAPGRHQDELWVEMVHPHPVWKGITRDELSRRRGVVGFYGRGGYPDLEAGDVVINRIQYLPIDVELKRGGGRVLLHGGNDVWSFGQREEPGRSLSAQLLRWGLESW